MPFTVTVDGADHLEGVDLYADGFYTAFVGSRLADSTATPGPGRFLHVYRRLIDEEAPRRHSKSRTHK